MSEYEQVDEAGAANPGARDSGVAHDSRSAHTLESSGYQEPPGDEADESSGMPGAEVFRRRPGGKTETRP
jgi:hypothetical protein